MASLKIIIRSLVTAILGLLAGAFAGAFTFGWNTSMAEGSSWIGPTREFWPMSAYVGGLLGAGVGVALGLFVSLAGLRIRTAALSGGLVGMIGAAALWSDIGQVDSDLRTLPALIGPLVLSILLWVLIAVILSAVSSSLMRLVSKNRNS